MKHEEQIKAAARIPRWSTPAEARAQLNEEIDRFVKAAAEATGQPDAALALKVTAGLGKTATALRIIARYGAALLAHGHVLIYVPTLDLAERAHADFRVFAPGLPARVLRGRDALRPDNHDEKMCARADIARKISGLVPSVTQALCRGLDPNGDFVQSPCAKGCPYLAQKDVTGAYVVFLSHAYLTVDPPVDRDFRVVLRVVDEKVWPTLTRTSHLAIDDLMRAPPGSFPENLHDSFSRAKAAIVDGLQRDLPLHDHLRNSGIDTMELQRLSQAEGQARCHLDIGPWQSPEAVNFCVETFDRKLFIASRQRQRILERLAEKGAGHCVGVKLLDLTTDGGSKYVIQSASIDEIERDAPLLLLDADADPDITERIAPSAALVSIHSPPVADIVQVSDLTLSNSWLLHPIKGAERRAAVLTILKREVDRAAGGGVLVVATKSILAALHGDVGNTVADTDEETLRQPLLGAAPRWFGPRTQTEIVGQAQEMLASFLNEEEDRLDAWRDDAKVSFDQQIKTLNKESNEKKKLARATLGLEEKLTLQREAKALQRQVDDLQHQLYTRLREIDEERERMLDEIAEQLNLTPEMTPLFTIKWSLA